MPLITNNFIGIRDVCDIIIVALAIYTFLKLIRYTRAELLLKGILVLLIIQQLSQFLGLHTVNYILQAATQVGLIALLVVFQPELRRALEQMGRSKFVRMFLPKDTQAIDKSEIIVGELCEATVGLANKKIGSIIIIERTEKIDDIVRTGIVIQSDISSELLMNIFVPNTPLHDGATIIRGGRIYAASCFLPLTQNPNLSLELGTRHRAAIGISEVSDCMVIVTSEETGKISIASGGNLTRNLTVTTLKAALQSIYNPPDETFDKPKHWWNVFSKDSALQGQDTHGNTEMSFAPDDKGGNDE
ncbi:MAG: diadenylate cyclase CdaA [Clostridiales bacterium]|jgi:diadenylate cyclase|nr:diadenylate cyclase CdaA [Clostridiales bacterium]